MTGFQCDDEGSVVEENSTAGLGANGERFVADQPSSEEMGEVK